MIDNETVLGEGQAVTSAAVNSTNVLKTGAGDAVVNPFIISKVSTAFAGGTSLQIELQTASDEAFTSPKTLISKTALLADLTANAEVVNERIPYGGLGYYRVKYTPTGTFTAGAIDSYIVPQADMGK